MKPLITLLLVLSSFFVFATSTFAMESKLGIHVLSENDLETVRNTILKQDEAWGYVTIVIREDEMDVGRWRQAFTTMKDKKIIPIVRIATRMNSLGYWEKPEVGEAKKWASFLNELPWPTDRRYILLFNEPNHSKEWGGELNPKEYAVICRRYWEEFKRASFDFSVLPAGFDAAAPNSKDTMDSGEYFKKMYESDELIFTLFDGWSSHSYPNPGFSGSPNASGKMSIRGYEWELNFLADYNLDKNIPVFITETGWALSRKLNREQIARNYQIAFSNVWSDSRVKAVTPFIMSYDQRPFHVFSWKDIISGEYFDYYKYVSLEGIVNNLRSS